MEPLRLRAELRGHEEDVRATPLLHMLLKLSEYGNACMLLRQSNCTMDPQPRVSVQVRGLCICELGLLTSSRDRTAKLWHEESANIFRAVTTYVRHALHAHVLTRRPMDRHPRGMMHHDAQGLGRTLPDFEIMECAGWTHRLRRASCLSAARQDRLGFDGCCCDRSAALSCQRPSTTDVVWQIGAEGSRRLLKLLSPR